MNESQITGKGYGDKHTWIKLFTNTTTKRSEKYSLWECIECGKQFKHFYDVIPDIFSAIHFSRIPENCKEDKS